MKKKTILPRIILDALLILVLITLYSKNVISLMYHEIAGLALLGLFAIHLVFNRKWFSAVLKKVFSKSLPAKSRVMSAVNALLILAWLAVLVTGVLVSKKVFSIQISSLNPWHFFVSAVALILTGIHFGLHWKYFWGFLGKKIHLNRAISIVLIVAISGLGVYNVASSSFGRWITAPFSASAGHGEGFSRNEGEMTSNMPGENTETNGQNAPADPAGSETQTAPGSRRMGKGGAHGQQQPFSFTNLLSAIQMAFSVMFLFAAATYWVDTLLKKRKASPRTLNAEKNA